jgi:hypothetical protein
MATNIEAVEETNRISQATNSQHRKAITKRESFVKQIADTT